MKAASRATTAALRRTSGHAALHRGDHRLSGSSASSAQKQVAAEANAAPEQAAKKLEAGDLFTSPELAYGSKSTVELLRAVAVLRICGIQMLVNHADRLVNMATAVLGQRFVHGFVLKKTFFGHFCGGENVEELGPFLGKLRQVGVGAILDYAAEEDVGANKSKDSDAKRDREGILSARVYDYHGEAECDANARTVMECISHASALGKDQHAFAAMKLTALCKPKVLERMSKLLMAARRSWVEGFAQIPTRESLLTRPAQEIRSIVSCPEAVRGVDLQRWKEGLNRICVNRKPTDAEAERMFNVLKNSDGVVDYIDYTRKVTLESLRVSFDGADDIDSPQNDMRPLTHSGALPLLDEVDSQLLDNMVRRIEAIAKLAVDEKVNIMVDAEQTYMQVAIDHFTTMLQRIYNVEDPRVFNTYQCYLTYSKIRILNDLERSKREGWKFAGKLVRGAYMVQERALAKEHSYTSPIFPTIEDTHRNFDECVEIILNQMPQHDCGLMIGSHNVESIQKTVSIMERRGIEKRNGGVYFGQLMGMADQLTFPLGLNGYNAYKYVPYGPVHEVMPYLIRRAQENSGMKAMGNTELALLHRELKRRFKQSARLA